MSTVQFPCKKSIHLIDSGHLSQQAEEYAWNPVIDIMATTTKDGHVVLYGNGFKVLWKSPSIDESIPCRPSWRLDGKFLAVGYSSGRLCLFSQTSPQPKYRRHFEGVILSTFWHRHSHETSFPQNREVEELRGGLMYVNVNFCDLLISHCGHPLGRHYIDISVGGVHTLLRVELNDILPFPRRDNNTMAMAVQEETECSGALPEKARILIWLGSHLCLIKLPVDWDAITHCAEKVTQVVVDAHRSWIPWCLEVWDTLGTLKKLEERFAALAADMGGGLDFLRDQLLLLLATGRCQQEKLHRFMVDCNQHSAINSNSALLVAISSCDKLRERLFKMLSYFGKQHTQMSELMAVAEFFSPAFEAVHDEANRICSILESISCLSVFISERVHEHSKHFLPFFHWFILSSITAKLLDENENNEALLPKDFEPLCLEDLEIVESFICETFAGQSISFDPISKYFSDRIEDARVAPQLIGHGDWRVDELHSFEMFSLSGLLSALNCRLELFDQCQLLTAFEKDVSPAKLDLTSCNENVTYLEASLPPLGPRQRGTAISSP